MNTLREKIIFGTLMAVWGTLLLFLATFACVQWGYSNGKKMSLNVTPEMVQELNKQQIFSIAEQVRQDKRYIEAIGFTYTIVYDRFTCNTQAVYVPSEKTLTTAWERYKRFLQFNNVSDSFDSQTINYILNGTSQAHNIKQGAAYFVASCIGWLGYNQGKEMGCGESYVSYMADHKEIMDAEFQYAKRLEDPGTWKDLLIAVEKYNKVYCK